MRSLKGMWTPRRHRAWRGWAAGAAVLASGSAHGATCPASSYESRATSSDSALAEAHGLAAQRRWADARAIYLWLLARDDNDAGALFGLARIDAWEGCWALAEREYARLLAAHPPDADVRAAYADLLMWQGRFEEADRLLREGIARDPKAAALVGRMAKLIYWRGDVTRAIAAADDATRLAPDDADLRAVRDGMFSGEARLTGRLDRYPAGYDDLFLVAAQALERFRRFDVYAGAQLLKRYGSAPSAPLDARYPVGAAWHPGMEIAVGWEIAPGAPANAVPNVALKTWAIAPIAWRLSGFFAYAFWHYRDDAVVHIANPALGFALPWELRLDLRAWVSSAAVPGQAAQAGDQKVAGAAGFHLAWASTPKLGLGAWYTYGAELDRNPALFQLLSLRTHVLGAYGDFLLARDYGLRPSLGIARREAPNGIAIWIPTAEVGAYLRW